MTLRMMCLHNRGTDEGESSLYGHVYLPGHDFSLRGILDSFLLWTSGDEAGADESGDLGGAIFCRREGSLWY